MWFARTITLRPLSSAASLVVIELVKPVVLLSGIAAFGVAQRRFAVVKLRTADSALPQPLTDPTRQK